MAKVQLLNLRSSLNVVLQAVSTQLQTWPSVLIPADLIKEVVPDDVVPRFDGANDVVMVIGDWQSEVVGHRDRQDYRTVRDLTLLFRMMREPDSEKADDYLWVSNTIQTGIVVLEESLIDAFENLWLPDPKNNNVTYQPVKVRGGRAYSRHILDGGWMRYGQTEVSLDLNILPPLQQTNT